MKFNEVLNLSVKDLTKIQNFQFNYDKTSKCWRKKITIDIKNLQDYNNSYSAVISIYEKSFKITYHFYCYNDLATWYFDEFYEDGLTIYQKELQDKFIQFINQMISEGILECQRE